MLKGWAPDSLLDTYEAERRPVAEHNLARSLDPMGSRRSVHDECVSILVIGFRMCGLRLGGPHLEPRPARSRIHPAERGRAATQSDNQSELPPVTTHRLDRKTAAALGADQPGGILLRPDGVIWAPPPSAALAAA